MAEPAPTPCNISGSQMIQLAIKIVQILQTISILITQIRDLCVKNLLRIFFDVLFYFTPQLNPFRLLDAYNAAAETIRKQQAAKPGYDQKPRSGDQRTTSEKTVTFATEELDEKSEAPNNSPPVLPSICGSI
ncbi:hypothetical protein SEUCBS139899_010704 [Sporothrix eucalyptigena]|uniref:Uncharacterized protein n=1 Tax=Sporothrix eucalyptigena TaxID=1812306 RepID=A0ABP0D3A6_9PEZI